MERDKHSAFYHLDAQSGSRVHRNTRPAKCSSRGRASTLDPSGFRRQPSPTKIRSLPLITTRESGALQRYARKVPVQDQHHGPSRASREFRSQFRPNSLKITASEPRPRGVAPGFRYWGFSEVTRFSVGPQGEEPHLRPADIRPGGRAGSTLPRYSGFSGSIRALAGSIDGTGFERSHHATDASRARVQQLTCNGRANKSGCSARGLTR